MNNNEVIGGIYVINDATGILETPRRGLGILTLRTLLETGVQFIGQMVQIQSTVMPIYNGIYRVVSVQHRGMISGAVCGKMESIFTLQAANLYGVPGAPTNGTGFTVIPLAQATAA